MYNVILQSLATIGTIVGLALISEGIVIGWYVSIASNILWIMFANALQHNGYGIMLVNLVLFFIGLNGAGLLG